MKACKELVGDRPRRGRVFGDSAIAFDDFLDVDGAIGEAGNEQNGLFSEEHSSGGAGVEELLGIADLNFPDFSYFVEVPDSAFDKWVTGSGWTLWMQGVASWLAKS